MRERTIMIFPKFNNMEIIDSIQKNMILWRIW